MLMLQVILRYIVIVIFSCLVAAWLNTRPTHKTSAGIEPEVVDQRTTVYLHTLSPVFGIGSLQASEPECLLLSDKAALTPMLESQAKEGCCPLLLQGIKPMNNHSIWF